MSGPGPAWLPAVERAVGPVAHVRSLAGSVFAVEAAGRRLVVKPGPGALDEADGLRALAAIPGAPPVPEVLLAEGDLLVTSAIDQKARTASHEVDLGRSLAHLHDAPREHWGGGSSWVGRCPVDPGVRPDAVAFYAARLTELAARCGMEQAVAGVVRRLGVLLPDGGPATVHGDLWWGNVLFGADGRSWLVDPSLHGGHPEEDLAMLALFGPVPGTLSRAYDEVRPPAPGWRERLPLFQLCPLLVHAVLFGGSYRARAAAVCRSLIR